MIRKLFKTAIDYYRHHFWCRFMLLFAIAVSGIAVIFVVYLQNQYYSYLTEKQYLMETAVLENAKNNLDSTLREYINIGAEMAASPDICEEADFLHQEDNFRNRLNLSLLLTASRRNSNKLAVISIIDENGLLYQHDVYKYSSVQLWSEENNRILTDEYQEMMALIDSGVIPRYLVGTAPDRHPANESMELFHLYFPMIGSSHDIKKVNKVLCLSFQMDVMNQFVQSMASNDMNYLKGYVTDENDVIVSHSDKEYIGMPEARYLISGSLTCMSKELDVVGWRLNIAYDDNQARGYVNDIFSRGLLFYVLLIAVLMLVLYFLIKWTMNPVSKIRHAMVETVKSRTNTRIAIEGNHEIWKLAEKYNEMLDALEEKDREAERHHEQLLQSVERQHEAEREALETQISGHFICNTLNTINYEAIEEGNHKVSVLIQKLSNILRYSFDQKCQDVYFYQEFAWIEQYLFLMKSRLEDVFEYEVTIPEEVSAWPCCKLILQPFVENAIIHGFEGMQNGGLLKVNACKEQDNVRISIYDNGLGMTEEKEKNIRKIIDGKENEITEKTGIGIRNVLNRMRLYYGDNMKAELKTSYGNGTEFIFYLPFPNGRMYQKVKKDANNHS